MGAKNEFNHLKHDIGLLRTDATSVGLMLAQDRNQVPQYRRDDISYLAQQYFTTEPDYSYLRPEEEIAIRQADWCAGFGQTYYDRDDPKRYEKSIGMDLRFQGMGIAGPLASKLLVDRLILRPNAAGDLTELSPSAGSNYECVDEVYPNDTDFVRCGTTAPVRKDLYNLPAHWGAGTISKITVYWRGKEDDASDGDGQAEIKTGGAIYDGSSSPLTTTWTDFTHDWATNPATSAAWTWDDIDALQIGVGLRQATTTTYSYCSHVYVEVYANAVPFPIDSVDAGTTKCFQKFNSLLYIGTGQHLLKVNANGICSLVKTFSVTITDLCAFTETNSILL